MPNVKAVNDDGTRAFISVTDDGEVWTTETERENDVYSVYHEIGLSTNKYIVLVDRNGPTFPHSKLAQGSGRIDVTSIHYTVEVSVSAGISLMYGVVTRINATDADISYFLVVPMLSGTSQEDRIVSLRLLPSQIKLDVDQSGALTHGITNEFETNVASVNSVTALDSPAGSASIVPDVGDLILKFARSSGTANLSTLIMYHAHK